jgi:hypothetical protein
MCQKFFFYLNHFGISFFALILPHHNQVNKSFSYIVIMSIININKVSFLPLISSQYMVQICLKKNMINIMTDIVIKSCSSKINLFFALS